jgi:3-hydroxy-9,10-secoandrosta-1,3,5(10)-triene-9,17-dione monooxygenase
MAGERSAGAEVLARVREIVPAIAERAAAAETAARLPVESVEELIAAGITRILIPERHGGYELGLESWLEVVLEIAGADASHGWCASLLIHHPHYLAQFPEAAQQAVWGDGPDVAIATSLEPCCEIREDRAGYRVGGRAPYASGILHSSWILVGGLLADRGPALFLIPPGAYAVEETWFTTAMRATGSNTAVLDDVPVAAEHVLALADMREGRPPGAAVNTGAIYRAPWMSYATLSFSMPILGAARGALSRVLAKPPRRLAPGAIGRAASDLDAAELLARRAIAIAGSGEANTLELRARAMRDSARVAELSLGALDALVALGGSSAFAAANPIQRAWRDAHFAASHIALAPDANLAHWGRTVLGLERPPEQIFY